MNKYVRIIMKRKWKTTIPLLLISSLIFSIGIGVWINTAKAFPAGLTAYPQLLIYLLKIPIRYNSIILFTFNIPLFIIFYKTLKKPFIIYTFIWLIMQLLWSQLIFSFDINTNLFNLPLDPKGNLEAMGRILYSIIGAILVAFSAGIAILSGGSTGGTDFIAAYFYLKKRGSFGSLSIIFKLFTVFTSILIQYLVLYFGRDVRSETITSVLFGVTMFITLIYIMIYGVIINIVYPRHKKMKIEICSKKMDDIVKYLVDSKFHHGYSIGKEKSIYSKKNTNRLVTVISYMEVYSLAMHIREIDKDAWMTVVYVKNIFGRFNDKLIDD